MVDFAELFAGAFASGFGAGFETGFETDFGAGFATRVFFKTFADFGTGFEAGFDAGFLLAVLVGLAFWTGFADLALTGAFEAGFAAGLAVARWTFFATAPCVTFFTGTGFLTSGFFFALAADFFIITSVSNRNKTRYFGCADFQQPRVIASVYCSVNENHNFWQPRACRTALQARAELYADVRSFFRQREVMEVDTPILSQGATVDPNIDSFSTGGNRWLHTSPEFAMKRLLASTSGPIYQICHAFRREEAGRLHNPEFTLLEWYRPGWNYRKLMTEMEQLLEAVGLSVGEIQKLSYREVFLRYADTDPFSAKVDDLRSRCENALGEIPEPRDSDPIGTRDYYLDLLMGSVVAPRLGLTAPIFVMDFPISQAALARVRADQPPVAERFELLYHGIELANGFSELTDAREQAQRFEANQSARARLGREVPPSDMRLIEALASGMPDCAGVALGLDRLLMLLLKLDHIGDTLAFDFERA